MSMFVFKTVVLVLVLGSQMLGGTVDSCGFNADPLPVPDDCQVTWKPNEDQPLQTDTFDNCTFSKQHIIATLPNGVDWEIWENPNETGHSYDLGTATFYGGVDSNGKPQGAYYATWSNSGDFISRAGLQFDKVDPSNPTQMKKGCAYTAYGAMTAEYSFKKIAWDGVKDIAGGYSYVGIYGWARNPLVEFYIIDDWFGKLAPDGNPASNPVPKTTVCNDVCKNECKIGEYTLDGGDYILYSKTRGPAYSINGPDKCFTQIYAVRKISRQCGTIHIDKHFAEWAKSPFKLVLNEMYEAKILVEAGGGTGWIDFTHLTVTKETECTTGGNYPVGSFASETYVCPNPANMPPPPNNQIRYEPELIPGLPPAEICPGVGDDDDDDDDDDDSNDAQKLWNKKAWVSMVVLSVVFLLFW